ncbi:hypothetical protein [Dactylosporangium sp. NPDC005555]|uniref:hypothetical protein n=1 Tax=Dactylosporangium sp. NPDC005555 TaxID=3154889 RepID=UPI0033A29E0D
MRGPVASSGSGATDIEGGEHPHGSPDAQRRGASSPAVAAPNGTTPNTKIRDAAVTRPSRCAGTKVPRNVMVITFGVVAPASATNEPAANSASRQP